jgi:hypothetical protein
MLREPGEENPEALENSKPPPKGPPHKAQENGGVAPESGAKRGSREEGAGRGAEERAKPAGERKEKK